MTSWCRLDARNGDVGLSEWNPVCDATECFLIALRSYILIRPSVSCGLILLEVTVVFGISYFRSLPAMAL